MNNTLANGLDLLGFLSGTAAAYSVTELAQRLGLPKSHVHRLLQTLVERGYAVQDEDRRYRIGLQPLAVSKALLANHPLRGAALPHLHRLTAATGMDAIVSIPDRDGCALVIGAVHPGGELRDPASAIGNRLPCPGTATGKLFAVAIPGFADPAAIPLRERQAIARDGCAVKDPRLEAGFNGIAVLVRDGSGTVAGALGLSAPAAVFAAGLAAARTAMRAAAADLATALSHRSA